MSASAFMLEVDVYKDFIDYLPPPHFPKLEVDALLYFIIIRG